MRRQGFWGSEVRASEKLEQQVAMWGLQVSAYLPLYVMNTGDARTSALLFGGLDAMIHECRWGGDGGGQSNFFA